MLSSAQQLCMELDHVSGTVQVEGRYDITACREHTEGFI